MPFLNPVDHVRLGIPDYPLHIKHPMDLGTIWLNLRDKPWDPKVRARKYQNPSEFLADVRLVFENCRIFNPAGQPVRSMGDQLSELFEKVWLKCDLEAKWRNLEAASMPQGDEEQVIKKPFLLNQSLVRVSNFCLALTYEAGPKNNALGMLFAFLNLTGAACYSLF